MNKTDYMQSLRRQLRRLPKEDFDKAIDYFEEYFSEAGVENEAQVIDDLGTPEFAAEQIITDIALKNTETPVKDVKKGINAVWVGILAVFAAPIALPLALSFAIVVIAFIFCILALFASFILTGILFTLLGPFYIIAGITSITTSIPIFISCAGIGLTSMGIGMLLTFGMIRLSQRFLTTMIRFFGRLIRKGENKNEQKK